MYNPTLSAIIKKYAALALSEPTGHAYNSQILRSNIVSADLRAEIQFCRLLEQEPFDAVQFALSLLDRCRARAEFYQTDAPSYGAMPEATVNQLYWELVMEVFEPITLGQILQILMPNLRYQAVVDISDLPRGLTIAEQKAEMFFRSVSLKRKDYNNFQFKVGRNPLTTLHYDIANKDSGCLKDYVFTSDCIFRVADIADFTFEQHQQWYRAVAQQSPELASLLYAHNATLRVLEHEIKMVAGLTVREALERLINMLLLSGEHQLGVEEKAAKVAKVAVGIFLNYLHQFPPELKQQCLQLATPSGKSLEEILYHDILEKDECAEINATALREILLNPANEALLDTHPILTPEQIAKIKAHYYPGCDFKTAGSNESAKFPEVWVAKEMSGIEVNSPEKCADLLLQLAPEQVDIFFQYARFSNVRLVFEGLVLRIALGNFFSEAMNQALLNALLASGENFLGPTESRYNRLIHEPIFLRAFANMGNTVWQFVAKTKPELILTLLKLFPLKYRCQILKKRVMDEDTVLHHFVENKPQLFLTLLQLIPRNQYLGMLCLPKRDSDTVCHRMAEKDPESFLALLQLITERDYFYVLSLLGKGNDTVYDRLASTNPDFLLRLPWPLPLEVEESGIGLLSY